MSSIESTIVSDVLNTSINPPSSSLLSTYITCGPWCEESQSPKFVNSVKKPFHNKRLLHPYIPEKNKLNIDINSDNKYVSPLIRISDTQDDLILYHYVNCDETSEDFIKSSRGIIRSGDNIICKTFGFTPEILSTNSEEIKKLLPSIQNYKIYDAEEGAILRLYYHNNKWYLSTHRKINAYHSRWGNPSSQSFGDMFIDSLEWEIKNGSLKDIVYQNKSDIFNLYCEKLDKNKNYTFIVRNTKENRIVCDVPLHPQSYFIGSFDNKLHLLVEGNDSSISYPNSYNFNSVDELLNHVNNINYTLKQGVIGKIIANIFFPHC